MTARDALEQARSAARRITELDARIARLEDIGGCDPSAPMWHSPDPSWRIADAVAQADELRRRRSEYEAVVSKAGAAIWSIDFGEYEVNRKVSTVLSLIYLEDMPRRDAAVAIGRTADGIGADHVDYIRRRGINWLDEHNILW